MCASWSLTKEAGGKEVVGPLHKGEYVKIERFMFVGESLAKVILQKRCASMRRNRFSMCPSVFCLGRGHLRPSTSAYAWGTELWFEHLGDFFFYIDPTLRHMSRTVMGL